MKDSFSKPQHEPQLARGERRARGVFYTPAEIADWIVEQSYLPLLKNWHGAEDPPSLLDPACGAGVFLLAAERLLRERCVQLEMREAEQTLALNRALHGIDVDPATIASAKQQAALHTANLHCADALATLPGKRFDVVVGNPPYVSIRELARHHSHDYVNGLRERFRTAHGNFDLYVLFIERALQLLKPGGRLGFIIPNKWATLDYASKLRETLLRETTLEQIVDMSTLRVFPQAGTYPQIILLQRTKADSQHSLKVAHIQSVGELQPARLRTCTHLVLQSTLQPRAFVLGNEIRVEDRVSTQPLESVATLHSGASGYSANLLAAELREAENSSSENETVDFIVSGNIDRYAIQPGNVRFLNHTWQRPCLPLKSAAITAAKRKLYREPKIIFSGMSRRLEAAYDEQGCALGVQVYAACDITIDPFYLLGVLNSKLVSYLFRERFAAKSLAGGYLSINKGQLAQLPIHTEDCHAGSLPVRISQLAQRLHSRSESIGAELLEQKLDALIYEIYAISSAEQQLIETSFATSKQQAARKRAA